MIGTIQQEQYLEDSLSLRSVLLFIPSLLLSLYGGSSSAASLEDLISSTTGSPELSIDAAVFTPAGECFAGKNLDIVATGSARFHAASISKLLTAVRILQLRDEGLLQLDDPVSTHHVLFPDADYSVQHLLTHTSGLRDRTSANARHTDEEVQDYLRSLNRQRRRSEPEEEWRYADAGFNVLGAIIAELADTSYARAMQVALLEPLNMANSSFLLADIPAEQRVVSYNRRGRAQDHPWDLAFAPSSGLQTTAKDLLQFARAILAVVNGENQDWLATATLQEMVSPRIDSEYEGIQQGLGWQLASSSAGPMWRHAGGEDGFESLLTIYPERNIAIVVLGNQDDWPRFQLERAIFSAAIEGNLNCN